MCEDQESIPAAWDAHASQLFIDFGRYFVPERESQIRTICDLIAPREAPFRILELCCGEGLLARALLQRFPDSVVYGYDGAPEMLERAQETVVPYGDRFVPRRFDLAADDWRRLPWPVDGVVSSLAIHHLDGAQKQQLFRDVFQMLAPGGALVIADLIEPAHPLGVDLAARTWDEAVRRRGREIDGDERAWSYFERERWNLFRYPDPEMDKPSGLFEQLCWLQTAGFEAVDVHWLLAGHAVYGGRKGTA